MQTMKRKDNRSADELREVRLLRHYTCHAEGSVLISVGKTQVLCNASLEEGVPRFLRGKGQGWLTAEYGMLPRSTASRMNREGRAGRQSGRTLEIQRLIGRTLRSAVDLRKLGERTMTLDCDVIQADGGTRTAAITGACVALVDALRCVQRSGQLQEDPLRTMVAAVSVGIHEGAALLDLDYSEDSTTQTDMNVVMDSQGRFLELQGTAEGQPFSREDLDQMLALAQGGIQTLLQKQLDVLREA